jgi:hypothetical protein
VPTVDGMAFEKHYRILDHLGSTRMVLDKDGATIAKYDYEPFGKQIPLQDGKTRSKYISKEIDNESKLSDHALRENHVEKPS